MGTCLLNSKKVQKTLMSINQLQEDYYHSNKNIIQYDIIKEESPFSLLKLNETDITCKVEFVE